MQRTKEICLEACLEPSQLLGTTLVLAATYL